MKSKKKLATKKKKKTAGKGKAGVKRKVTADAERRRYDRRVILDTFHVFMCIKERGLGKFYLRDISENGFAFEVEDPQSYAQDQLHDCRFFINPGLSLPLKVRVAYISRHEGKDGSTGRIGAEIVRVSPKVKDVYQQFVKLLDQLAGSTDMYTAEAL